MKAVVVRNYGPPEVARVEDVPNPVAKPSEVLVRVAAAGVTVGDARLRGFNIPRGFGLIFRLIMGFGAPRRQILGGEFVGSVVGQGSAAFPAGTRVFGARGLALGSHAELLTIGPKSTTIPCPDELSDVDAAAFFFGGLTAADFLIDKAGLKAGERLLVNGATGAVGSAAMQIARHIGAKVTAVASAANHDFASDLGAEVVHDYRQGPVGGGFDVILDVAGTIPWSKARAMLTPGGRLLVVTGTLSQNIGAALRSRRNGRRVLAGVVTENRQAMTRLVNLWQAGAYRPIVTAIFPMDKIVEAYRLADGLHKRGNVVIVMPEATPQIRE